MVDLGFNRLDGKKANTAKNHGSFLFAEKTHPWQLFNPSSQLKAAFAKEPICLGPVRVGVAAMAAVLSKNILGGGPKPAPFQSTLALELRNLPT